jgi:hypothetical protein
VLLACSSSLILSLSLLSSFPKKSSWVSVSEPLNAASLYFSYRMSGPICGNGDTASAVTGRGDTVSEAEGSVSLEHDSL